MIEWLMMGSCFRPLACRIQPHRCPHRALPSHCTLAGTGPESNNGLLPHRRRMAKLRRQPKLCGHDATTLLELIDWLTWFNMWEPFKGGIETHQNAQKYTVDLSFIIKYNFIMICSLLFSLLNSWPRPQGRDRESACPAFRPVLLHSYSSFLQVAGHPWSKSAQ